MVLNLPVMLTWLRIFFIPVLIVVFYLPNPWTPLAAALIFAAAGVTDWADGYYARKWNQESGFGAFLDPVADKLIVAVALLLIVEREAQFWFTLPALIIISRELIISALREWMAKVGSSGAVAVALTGKMKTTAQMTALVCLLYNQWLWGMIPMREIGIVALVIATLLTILSMVEYLRGAFLALAQKT